MAKSRDSAKEQYWRGVIRRFEASGLGARRFCQREGLSEHRLHWWRRTLRQRDQDQAGRPGSRGRGKPVRKKAGKADRNKAGKPVRGKAGKRVRKKADRPARGGGGGPVRGRGDRGSDSAFLSVGLPFSVGGPIEVVHPRGHVIRVPAVFDPAALSRVLSAIDAAAGASEER
jgi:hypothetical protein